MERILITAAGGDVAQAVAKALRLSPAALQLHATDMRDGIALVFFDAFHRVPSAQDPGYVSALCRICDAHQISAVIPVSEPEIRALMVLPSYPALPNGVPIVAQSRSFVEKYGDKLCCCVQLEGVVPLAPFADGHNAEAVERFVAEQGFPICVKERFAYGSKGIVLARDAAALSLALARFPNPLLQGVIEGDDQEFSIGVFSTENEHRIISMRRLLGLGNCSWFAEVSEPGAVIAYCQSIAKEVKTNGSFNIQLRLTISGPRLLEINTRFSSLTAARAAAGFNDALWTLEHRLGKPVSPSLPIPAGFRFQRYFGEVVDLGHGFTPLPQWLPLRRNGDSQTSVY